MRQTGPATCLLGALALLTIAIPALAGTVPLIVQTGRNGDRLRHLAPVSLAGPPEFTIEVKSSERHQELAGFGASFTESSAWNLACLPGPQRASICCR